MMWSMGSMRSESTAVISGIHWRQAAWHLRRRGRKCGIVGVRADGEGQGQRINPVSALIILLHASIVDEKRKAKCEKGQYLYHI